ncbi:hypothetical protein FOL47_003343 [Perkinsus chesapeaki]|uniref:HYDIN/VesB/CFA65-like Ig-like domain-containing protein n=1 Tax=Perkinsus chesapeaki TaxID=330153 RepID=A0A7J6M8I7_PERCH|nr:hypothetical protein FOL47_003343 [Perkinsus chesapeaki]
MIISEIPEVSHFSTESPNSPRRHRRESKLSDIRIVRHLDIASHSLYRESEVPLDEPLFEPSPPVIRFTHYHGMDKLSVTLSLRNKDTVSRRVQVLPPQVEHFTVTRKTGKDRYDLVAPGMEVSFLIKFHPSARADYCHDLEVVTEREVFAVPIRAFAGVPKLDVPRRIDFGKVPVKYGESRVAYVRNVGDVAAQYSVHCTSEHMLQGSIDDAVYCISGATGLLEAGQGAQIELAFKPMTLEHYFRTVTIRYFNPGETNLSLPGDVQHHSDIRFSARNLQMDKTYIALSNTLGTRKSFIITNNSDVIVELSWRAFSSDAMDAEEKEKLLVQLGREQAEEQLYTLTLCSTAEGQQGYSSTMTQDDFPPAIRNIIDNITDFGTEEFAGRLSPSVSSSTGSESEAGSEAMKHSRMESLAMRALDTKYQNISRQIAADPLYFYDDAFTIEPVITTIYPGASRTITVTFSPSAALRYSCLAYCSIVGCVERIPITLNGVGIGPKAAFSYDDLDVGQVYVESEHQYEVTLYNQGEIAAHFELMPNNSIFGSRFTFEPNIGEMPVGESVKIVGNFTPKEIGEFHEVFHWQLAGSLTTLPIVFKGQSIAPSFTFDVDSIDFGLVSVGFLNTKGIILTNTSDVAISFILRVPADGRLAKKEFDLVPSRGSLQPKASQRIQVDFIPESIKAYELSLVVDLEGVGQELLSIPISAECGVPSVSFEPVEALSFGEVFIRYPFHKCLVIHNTSSLPAKFEILTHKSGNAPPGDPNSIVADVEPDQPHGRVPAASSHVVTLTLHARRPGPVKIPVYIKVAGHNVPYPITLEAQAVGPKVFAEPKTIDWGAIKCLDVLTKTIKLTNDCCIPARVRALMKTRGSPWRIPQKVVALEPQETYYLTVKLRPEEAQKYADVMYLMVEEGDDLAVDFKCRGTDTPVVCDDDVKVVDFGTQYTTQKVTKDIVLKNFGRKPRTITWLVSKEAAREKALKQLGKDGAKPNKAKLPAVPYTIHPVSATLKSGTGYRFTITACSEVSGLVEDVVECIECIGASKKGKTIYQSTFKSSFVAPLLRMSEKTVTFRYMWSADEGGKAPVMTRPLEITNISPLPITFSLKVPAPFAVRIPTAEVSEGAKVEGDSITLGSKARATVEVDFDPSFKIDRQCGTANRKIHITYADHPQKDHVEAVGEVVFPNLSFDKAELDFGAVLNYTVSETCVKVTNTSDLPSDYRWEFILLKKDSKKRKAILPNVAFDIEPICGTIAAQSSEMMTFRFNGVPDRLCEALARCTVAGGPCYDIRLRGRAAEMAFRVDKTSLDFGSMQFDTSADREIMLFNKCCVPVFFEVDLRGLNRKVVAVTPNKGVIAGDGKERLVVKFSPGIPSEVSERFLIRVSHLPPVAISVNGLGVYPAVVLNLPRTNAEEHARRMEEMAERIPIEMPQASPTSRGPSRRASIRSNTGFRDRMGSVVFSDRADTPDSVGPKSSPAAAMAAVKRAATLVSLMSRKGSVYDMAGVAPPHTVTPFTNHTLRCTVEIDRASLCDALIAAERQSASALPMTPSNRKKARQLTSMTVAGTYFCDFGDIVLGQSRRQPFTVYNCHSTEIMLSISRKELMEEGFVVTPEQVGIIPPGGSLQMSIIAELPKDADEGTRELVWELPIQNGPRYAIHLRARHEIPELSLPVDHVDFGEVIMGHRSKRYVRLINDKHVPLEWVFRPPTTKFGQPLPPWEVPFTISPTFGVLEPGQSSALQISFTPNGVASFHEKIALRIKDNKKPTVLSFSGTGAALEVHLEEEGMLMAFDRYDEHGIAEMPLREVGSSTWSRLSERVESLRQAAENAAQAAEGDMAEEEGRVSPDDHELDDDEGESVPEQREEDYPNRVPSDERVSVIILGLPKSGKTTVARALEAEHSRKLLTVDECIEWALSNPRSLRDDYVAQKLVRRVRDATAERESAEETHNLDKADVADIIRRRVDLSDCNTGVVWDDGTKESKYVGSGLVECILASLEEGERVSLITVNVEGEEIDKKEAQLSTYYSRLRELAEKEIEDVTEKLTRSENEKTETPAEDGHVEDATVDVEGLARAEWAAELEARKLELEGLLKWFDEEQPSTKASLYVEELSALLSHIRNEPAVEDDVVVQPGDAEGGAEAEEALAEKAEALFAQEDHAKLTSIIDWVEVATSSEQPDLKNVIDQALASVSAPSVPQYGRLPHPTTVQLIRKPVPRLPRGTSGIFNLLTPKAVDEEGEEQFHEQARWIIGPRSEQRVAVQFSATKSGTFSEQFKFEVVSGGLFPFQASVDVSGTAGLPHINSDPRNVFMRRIKNRPRTGYARKQFIASQSIFDFGPLLAGRTTEMRDEVLGMDVEAPQRVLSERLIRYHSETIRVTNNSLFPAEVRCIMASVLSAGSGQLTDDPDSFDDFPSMSLNDCPFVVESSSFRLEKDETRDVQLWCFPQTEGHFRDALAIIVKDNPEVIKWNVEALGAAPKADLDTDAIDFESLMVKQRDTRKIRVQNPSAIPIEWELVPEESAEGEETSPIPPPEMLIEPLSGKLAIGEACDIAVAFYTEEPISHDFVMNLVVRDSEGLNAFSPEPRAIHFKGEAFRVQVSVNIPGTEEDAPSNIIDFGDVRVGQVAEKSLELVNDGEHAVDYSLVVRGKRMRKLLSIDPPRGTLEPGQRQDISAVLVCPKAMAIVQSPEMFMKLIESRTGEEVRPEMPPLKISANAQFNRVSVNPSTDIDFGPLTVGETATELLNITNDGAFQIAWSLIDMKSREEESGAAEGTSASELAVGPFKVSPASGMLPPGEMVEVSVAFNALEEDNFSSKLGLVVEGTESGEPIAILLTGESYIPGLDTENLHLVFEEQFISKTREDAEATIGSSDLRVYCENDKCFTYGPIVQGKSITERFRLSNPTGVTVEVDCKLEQAAKDPPFTLSPEKLSLPPFEYRYVSITFSPKELGSFDGKFSAVVAKGTDASTNSLSFLVKGDGVVPSLSVRAPAFGSDGSNCSFDFGELPVGTSRETSFVLVNEHRIDATYRIERSGSGLRSFTVVGPVNATLRPGETRKLIVEYSPVAPAEADELVLKLITVHNDQESRSLKLNGRAIVLPVQWELPDDGVVADVPSLIGACRAHNFLNLGDIPVGSKKEFSFGLKNTSEVVQKFEMAEVSNPQLKACITFLPSVGHVSPGESKKLKLVIKPTEKIILDRVPLNFKLVGIELEQQSSPWDGSQKTRQSGIEVPLPEPPHSLLGDAESELPLLISVKADVISYECSQTEPILFAETVLYHARQHGFVLENTSEVAFNYAWRINDIRAGSAAHRAFSVTPRSGILQGKAKLDVAVRFNPTEVTDFSTARLELILPQKNEETPEVCIELDASATCPVCHFELVNCPTLPGRDDVRILKFQSLGTGVRNRKRFCVLNTTKNRYRFFWVDHRQALPEVSDNGAAQAEASESSRGPGDSLQPFGCVTRDGEIASGKKYEMEMHYTPMSYGRHESFWTFRVPSQELVVPFQLVGIVREPRLDIDSPSVNFGKVLVNYQTRRTVSLINREHLPFQFMIDGASWYDNALMISPMKGTIGPDGKMTLGITFKPLEEKLYNFNIIINVKRKAEPIILNIKGSAYKIKSTLSLLESADSESGLELYPRVPAKHDFGTLQVMEKRSFYLSLGNQSSFELEYLLQLRTTTRHGLVQVPSNPRMGLVPPFLKVTPMHGSAAVDDPTVIEVEYSPPDSHTLHGTMLKLLVGGNGPGQNVYNIDLAGSARRPVVDFSFTEKDFGPTFMLQSGQTSSNPSGGDGISYFSAVANLTITNRDTAPCSITTSKLGESEDFEVRASEGLQIAVGETANVPIAFVPKELRMYSETVEFTLNGCTKVNVRLKGRGIPLYLETELPEMQLLDFGHVSSEQHQTVTKEVVLVNRSAASVRFTLADIDKELRDKQISWQPNGMIELKRREKVTIRMSFSPASRMRPFMLPLQALLDGPAEAGHFSVRILNVKGASYSSASRAGKV